MARNEDIGFIGDLHIGAHGAAWNDCNPNKKHKYVASLYINECLEHLRKTWVKKGLRLLVLMGDIIEGPQNRNNHLEIYTADPLEQVEAAQEILEPFVKLADKVIRIEGTPYHEDPTGPLAAFDEKFKIKSYNVLDVKLPEGILNIAHHPSGGGAVYRGSVADRENLFSMLAAHEGKVPDARWIVRAHKHYYLSQETEFKSVCLNPCFKMQDRYSKKLNYWRFCPTFGATTLKKDEEHHLGRRFVYHGYKVPFEQPKSLVAL